MVTLTFSKENLMNASTLLIQQSFGQLNRVTPRRPSQIKVVSHQILLNKGENRYWRCGGPHKKKSLAPTPTIANLVFITRFTFMI